MDKKIISIGNINCGSDKLFLISGPCVIEHPDIMFRTAEHLKTIETKLNIPVIFKSSFTKDNRSRLDYYQGPGIDEGLRILDEIRKEFGFPILSDIHYPQQAEAAGEVLDIIQIPAYLCMQSSIVVAAAKTGKVINLKHGQFIAPENMMKVVQKVLDSGNDKIILTERGYTFGYNDLVVDPRSFYHLNNMGYPVVFDVTHAVRRYGIPSAQPEGGNREYLPVLAKAAIGAGIDGIFIETHPDPSRALCDAASQLCVYDLQDFLAPLIEIHKTVVKYK